MSGTLYAGEVQVSLALTHPFALGDSGAKLTGMDVNHGNI